MKGGLKLKGTVAEQRLVQGSLMMGLLSFILAVFASGATLFLSYLSTLVAFGIIAYLYRDQLFGDRWNTIITIICAWIIFVLLKGVLTFVLLEANWDVIWANRRLLAFGPYFTRTGEELWRLWPFVYMLGILLGSAYGSLGEKPHRFLIPFTIFAGCAVMLVSHDNHRGYDDSKSLRLLLGALATTYISFFTIHQWYREAKEYQVVALQRLLVYGGVATFFITVLLLDPPDKIGGLRLGLFFVSLDGIGLGFEVAGWPTIDFGILGEGVSPSEWGGLVLNLILASASIVIGFGVGVLLAFGRRSELPLFSWPSTAMIELIRSGPLVAWFFIAFILLPDVLRPIWDADSVSRTILILSLFFGCYLAEVLRGGIQAVSHGQVEAAIALGLSASQMKTLVILPQAIRTTMPAIVSLIIGIWKDTTLVYLLGVHDAFNTARVLPEQWDFVGLHKEALLFIGMVFWVLAFYLSRISLRIEASMGLRHEGGGDLT